LPEIDIAAARAGSGNELDAIRNGDLRKPNSGFDTFCHPEFVNPCFGFADGYDR
jgi:hypothetical protein